MTWGRLPHVEPASPSTPSTPSTLPHPRSAASPQKPARVASFLPSGRKRRSPWPVAHSRWTGNQEHWGSEKEKVDPEGGCRNANLPPPPPPPSPPNFFASTSASPGKQDRRQAVFVFRGPARSLKPQHWGSLVSTTGHVRDMAIRNTECRAICGRACSGSRECWLGSAGSSSQPAARS